MQYHRIGKTIVENKGKKGLHGVHKINEDSQDAEENKKLHDQGKAQQRGTEQ